MFLETEGIVKCLLVLFEACIWGRENFSFPRIPYNFLLLLSWKECWFSKLKKTNHSFKSDLIVVTYKGEELETSDFLI